jgi:hypothetical protein
MPWSADSTYSGSRDAEGEGSFWRRDLVDQVIPADGKAYFARDCAGTNGGSGGLSG